MGIRSVLAKPFAAYIDAVTRKWSSEPGHYQQKTLQYLLSLAKTTTFGRDHHFQDIQNYDDFKKHVPVRDYEALKPYIEQVLEGKSDILWPGKPRYFAKTSGTTSGTKYIPITKESLPNHFNSARDAVMSWMRSRVLKRGDYPGFRIIRFQQYCVPIRNHLTRRIASTTGKKNWNVSLMKHFMRT
jgi:hypothetical protein